MTDRIIKLSAPSCPELSLSFDLSRKYLGASWSERSKLTESERETVEQSSLKALTDTAGLLCLYSCRDTYREYEAAHLDAIKTTSDIQELLFKTQTPATPELIEAERIEALACAADSRALSWVREFPADNLEGLCTVLLTLIGKNPNHLSSLSGADCMALHATTSRALDTAINQTSERLDVLLAAYDRLSGGISLSDIARLSQGLDAKNLAIFKANCASL